MKLKNDLYYVGIMDKDLKVFDIIMETEFGTTYNSYILMGNDKVALFETAKAKFFDDYLEKIKEIVSVSKIDYIIMEHTEPDHAGSIAKLLELNPGIEVIGTVAAIRNLSNIINKEFNSHVVKENDILSLGDKTIRFIMAPNLHWPDTMYSYVEEDKVLITCDSFGAHFCCDKVLRSMVEDEEGYFRAVKYYYDNIMGPFKPFLLKALDKINGLDIDMICTGHGPVLDCKIEEMKESYREWSTVINPNTKKTVVITYVSAYGYTKQMADIIGKAIQDYDDINVKMFDLVEDSAVDALEEIQFADGLLFGSPTILGDALKPIWDVLTTMLPQIHSGKYAAAFGSYGWSGEGVPNITARLCQLKMKVQDGLKICFKPSEVEIEKCKEFGKTFAGKLV